MENKMTDYANKNFCSIKMIWQNLFNPFEVWWETIMFHGKFLRNGVCCKNAKFGIIFVRLDVRLRSEESGEGREREVTS